jgi:hypothetical protein
MRDSTRPITTRAPIWRPSEERSNRSIHRRSRIGRHGGSGIRNCSPGLTRCEPSAPVMERSRYPIARKSRTRATTFGLPDACDYAESNRKLSITRLAGLTAYSHSRPVPSVASPALVCLVRIALIRNVCGNGLPSAGLCSPFDASTTPALSVIKSVTPDGKASELTWS